MTYLIRFIKFIGIVLLFLAGAVLVDINRAGMAFVEGWYPGYGAWTFGALSTLEFLCLFGLWRSVFGRKSHLVLRLDADAEERQRFREALRRRLAVNPHVRKAGIESSDPLFVERALAVLDSIAEGEIRAGGSRVFLGTALAQNGRLDALIVFLSLCRTVWRISSIYTQKPLPAEIWSVYGVVSSATFVAFSIDALDIPQTITDAMSEMIPSVAPAMAASSVPLAGNIAKVFTSAAIHGAANCLLVVRAGVITRRAYRYAVSDKREDDLRSSCVPETAAIVKSISREAVASIAATLKKQFGLLARESGRRFVGGIADAAGTAGQKVSDVVTGVTGAAADTARSAAGVVTDAAHTAAAKAGAAGQRVSDVFGDAAKTASNVVTGAGSRAVGMAQGAMEKVAAAGGRIGESGRKIVGAVGGALSSAAYAAAEKTGEAGRKVMESSRNAAGAVRDTAVRAGHAAADAVTGTARTAAKTVGKAGERTADGVRNATKGAGTALRRAYGALGGLLRRTSMRMENNSARREKPKENCPDFESEKEARMPDLSEFSMLDIDWSLTPEQAVTMYLEWGNNDFSAEHPPVRSASDVSHYFVVDSWQDPPLVRLVRRNLEKAEDLITFPLPERFLPGYRAVHGKCRGLSAPTPEIMDWLKAELEG